MRENSGVKATLQWDAGSADFYLHFQSWAEHPHLGMQPESEVTVLKVDDPQLGEKIRILAQAFRMGQRHQMAKG